MPEADLASLRDILAVAAGAAHTLGLRTDGFVLAAGNNDFGQCETHSWCSVNA